MVYFLFYLTGTFWPLFKHCRSCRISGLCTYVKFSLYTGWLKLCYKEVKTASPIVHGVIRFCINFSFPWCLQARPGKRNQEWNDKDAQWANKLTLKISLNFLYDIFTFSLRIKAKTSSTLRSPSPLLSAERNTSFNQLNFVKENNSITSIYFISLVLVNLLPYSMYGTCTYDHIMNQSINQSINQ